MPSCSRDAAVEREPALRCRVAATQGRCGDSLADVGHQSHEAGALDGVLNGALEGGAVSAALAAEQLALAGAQLLERLHVLVVDERRPRAALFRAEPAAVFPSPTELLPNHELLRQTEQRPSLPKNQEPST